MKFPKNKANLFVVEREDYESGRSVVLAGFSEYDDATDFAGACEQEWHDIVGDNSEVGFKVTMTTFYG